MWYDTDRLCKVSLVLPEGNSGGNCDYSGGIRGYRSISGTARMVLEDTGGSQILPGGMRGCRRGLKDCHVVLQTTGAQEVSKTLTLLEWQ